MTYNGWSNYATWNVSMHLATYYHLIKDYARNMKAAGLNPNYRHFVKSHALTKTPDNVPYIHPAINFKEVESAFKELCEV